MRNRIVLESSHHMGDGIHVAQMGDIAGFLQRVLANRPEVNILNRSMSQLLGIALRRQAVEAIVGDLGDPDVCVSRVGLGGRKRCLGEDRE